ncbi:MAG: Gfo/Idh/MocA family oxidoreductase, partial [Candidatus Aminicenantes bacterium]|nr:Gfo/Idh/MocA family oxidoreductase [Candidatus Aminicenantes bacterium]
MPRNQSELNRRGFFRRTALTAAALSARSYGRVRGANHRLRIGIIGCGKIAGSHHLPKLLKMSESANVEVVAVSDVYRSRAKKFQDRISKAGGRAVEQVHHQDLLGMKDVDYVVIA